MPPDKDFWTARYIGNDTGWDIGSPSTPLKEYIDQLQDRSLRILIPGAGRAYEAEYLHRKGFRQVFIIDLADAPYQDLLQRCPDFPKEHLIVGDFFEHQGQYDLIFEQTFFCALDPDLRRAYVRHMHALLKPGGRLVGVLFDDPLNDDRPPYGGSRQEYLSIFGALFNDLKLERCHNSIPPRAGRELWLRAARKDPGVKDK
jgi:methyl halide transferase